MSAFAMTGAAQLALWVAIGFGSFWCLAEDAAAKASVGSELARAVEVETGLSLGGQLRSLKGKSAQDAAKLIGFATRYGTSSLEDTIKKAIKTEEKRCQTAGPSGEACLAGAHVLLDRLKLLSKRNKNVSEKIQVSSLVYLDFVQDRIISGRLAKLERKCGPDLSLEKEDCRAQREGLVALARAVDALGRYADSRRDELGRAAEAAVQYLGDMQ